MSDTPPEAAAPDPGISDLAREAAVQVAGPTGDGERPDFLRRQGYITAIASDWLTCSIKFPESTEAIAGIRFMHKSMHPHVGDTVWVDQNGPDTVVSSIGGLPVGAMTMYPSATAPAGWLLCNGQSTSGYPALAAVCGANVPDMRDKFPVGSGSAYAVGATGGVATVTEVQSHTHVLNSHQHNQTAHTHPGFNHNHSVPDHVHAQVVGAAVGGPGVRADYDQDASSSAFPQGLNTGGSGTLTTGTDGSAYSTGSGGGGLTGGGGVDGGGGTIAAPSGSVASVENRPPYRAVNFIIKHD